MSGNNNKSWSWDGERVRCLLRNLGISEYVIAKHLNISPLQLNAICANRSKPSINSLVNIQCFFGVSFEYLLGLLPENEEEHIKMSQINLPDESQKIINELLIQKKQSYEQRAEKQRTVNPRKGRVGNGEYPYNLLKRFKDCEKWQLTEDQLLGLSYAIETLTEREQLLIKRVYQDHYTFKRVAEEMGVSSSRISALNQKICRKLRHPARFFYIENGLKGAEKIKAEARERHLAEKAEKERAAKEAEEKKKEKLKQIGNFEIGFLDLSYRAYNSLRRAGVKTISEAIDLAEKGGIPKLRNVGAKTTAEILERLNEYISIESNK